MKKKDVQQMSKIGCINYTTESDLYSLIAINKNNYTNFFPICMIRYVCKSNSRNPILIINAHKSEFAFCLQILN